MKGVLPTQRRKSMTMRSLPTESVEDFSSALFPDLLVSPHSSEPVGRLQMANDFQHTAVLVDRIAEIFADQPAGLIVDATVGGGGHASRLLALANGHLLLGIDRDPAARAAATTVLGEFAGRFAIVAGTFGSFESALAVAPTFISSQPIVGILFDLGVSSPQLDDPDRGFSFRADAPLDMRMDPTQKMTAALLLEEIDTHELARLLHRHGENRFAGAIARSIKKLAPKTTGELVKAIELAVPIPARRRGHVASRAFQALRVEVNDEERQLDEGLAAAISVLAPGGVLAIISYHSGEDRVVKSVLHEAATGGCVCPTQLGCVCGAVAVMRVHRASAEMAGADEVALNARSRSARLRYGWKLAQ